MLRVSVDRLAKSYDFVVIDNEAGLEHLSRRTTSDIDVLLVVSDPTIRGITAAARVLDLVDELKTQVGRRYLVVNRVSNGLAEALDGAVSELKSKAEYLGTVPADLGIAELDAMGKPLVGIATDSPVYNVVQEIGRRVLGRQ
jgi:CO dehydrogenase maturation factor